MALRSAARDEVSSGGAIQDASRSILRMAGGWGNVTGPGIFMARTLFTGTINAFTYGLASATVGAMIWGTAALPFLIGACGGFILGAVGFYRDSIRQSLICLDRYPRLMQLHLDENFIYQGFGACRPGQLRREYFEKTWQRKSMLVCAWLTAQPALDQISEAREQELVDQTIKAPLTEVATQRDIGCDDEQGSSG